MWGRGKERMESGGGVKERGKKKKERYNVREKKKREWKVEEEKKRVIRKSKERMERDGYEKQREERKESEGGEITKMYKNVA